jgi:hypothetical protein
MPIGHQHPPPRQGVDDADARRQLTAADGRAGGGVVDRQPLGPLPGSKEIPAKNYVGPISESECLSSYLNTTIE